MIDAAQRDLPERVRIDGPKWVARLGLVVTQNPTHLSQDVLTVAPAALPATRSLLTLVDGKIVFEEPGGSAQPSAGER